MKKVYPERSQRVAVGLSGGVDSAVSAYLLKKQGFDISGVYLHCFDDDIPGCRGQLDRQDALTVALHLKIPFQVLDFRQQYKAAVIDYFKKEYLAGRTPNPDVICNRDIKFGLLLDWCIKKGFDYLATGHYADVAEILPRQNFAATPAPAEKRAMSRERIVRGAGEWQAKAGATVLQIPKDLHKDQTYFLWAVPKEKFCRVLFPLSDLTKKQVRSLAKLSGIPVADKPDSTGICFIGEVRVEDFLKRLGVREKKGEVVTASGRVIGSHRGVWFYTIGQRHGFTINPKGLTFASQRLDLNIPPLYVIAKDVKANLLVVGFGAETYREKFVVSNLNWLVDNKFFSQSQNSKFKTQNQVQSSKLKDIFVRIRHLGDLMPCQLLSVSSRKLEVALATPARGVAPGQSAVFYSKQGIVLGGGVIQ